MKNILIDFTSEETFGKPIEVSSSPSFAHRHKDDVSPCRSVPSGKCIECKGSGSLSGYISGTFGAYLSHHRYTVTCKECMGTGQVTK